MHAMHTASDPHLRLRKTSGCGSCVRDIQTKKNDPIYHENKLTVESSWSASYSFVPVFHGHFSYLHASVLSINSFYFPKSNRRSYFISMFHYDQQGDGCLHDIRYGTQGMRFIYVVRQYYERVGWLKTYFLA